MHSYLHTTYLHSYIQYERTNLKQTIFNYNTKKGINKLKKNIQQWNLFKYNQYLEKMYKI